MCKNKITQSNQCKTNLFEFENIRNIEKIINSKFVSLYELNLLFSNVISNTLKLSYPLFSNDSCELYLDSQFVKWFQITM